MRRVAIVGGGIAGLGAAWALSQDPEEFDFHLFEAQERLGGNAVTAEMPQEDGEAIPFDISVTACIPSVYEHIVILLERFGIPLLETRFSYSVKYQGAVYAHDFDSEIREQLADEIARFQKLLRRLHRIGFLSRSQSKLLNLLNPFNYISMGAVLDWGGYSGDFRYKVLKPMFVNFLMATNVFDMPAALFSRYLEFFDIESATTMTTWERGTQRIYEAMSAGFAEKISLNRPVRKVYREGGRVVVEDAEGVREAFDDVILACNANQSLMMLDSPSFMERSILASIRYDSELHNHALVHSDASVLPENEVQPLATRSNHIEQYGTRPDNYEITYIMHNQQPWAHRSDKPCLVTYNPISRIDESKIVERRWFQHVVHDVRQVVLLMNIFRFIQGRGGVWHAGAHTLINSQETCLVSGMAVARQLGASYPFEDEAARRTFNYYGGIMFGWRFRRVRG